MRIVADQDNTSAARCRYERSCDARWIASELCWRTAESRYRSAFLFAALPGNLEVCGTCGTLCRLSVKDSDPLKRWLIGRNAANKRAPAHKTPVIRLTICLADPAELSFRKGRNDLRKWTRCRAVIGPLPKRDSRFLKMTNAPRFSTVPVSPQRVTEE